jgi:lactate dehydrogenase-like 2-hydroxyacid dehydrogenase
VGYESFIDVRAATARGIRVTNTPGTLTNSVAEFTVGQLLNARRRLTQYTNAFMRGQHGTETKQRDLAGTTVGIIGLGAIGSRIAQILRAGFNCPVIYFSRTRKADLEQQLGIKYAPLDDLAGAADALVVMTPGNETTTNLVGQTVFSTMKAGSLVVNTARPAIVNPQGLLAALKANVVAIAAFDGFYPPECPERAELLALGDERLLVTGHIGSLTAEARDGMALKAVQSIVNVLQHGADAYVINSE